MYKKILFLFFLLIIFTSCSIYTKKKEKGIEGINQTNIIEVTGKGVVPDDLEGSAKGYLMAERAAVIDGYRLLTEKIAGLIVQANSENQNFTVSKDKIYTYAKSFLKGAEVLSIRHLKNNIAEADIRIILPNKKLSKSFLSKVFGGNN